MVEIPYVKSLYHKTYEAGPVNSSDLFNLLRASPGIKDTGYFSLGFLAEHGMPGSSGDLVIDPDGRRLDIKRPSLGDRLGDIGAILGGGQLAELNLRYPPFNSTEEDFERAGDAFDILKANLGTIEDLGYAISSLKLLHHMVKVSDRYPGFFSRDYGAKMVVTTASLLEGRPEQKLVLEFTPELESSAEVRAYKEFLDSIHA